MDLELGTARRVSSPQLNGSKGVNGNWVRRVCDLAIKVGFAHRWLAMHESGTFVRFTPAGAELFA